MKSLIEGLPPEIAQRIHPDWRKNEGDYWARRDEVFAQYRDQWIGYANGRVIVTGRSPVEVFHKAQESGEHPFVTCVGREHEPSRMRRATFAYDTTYAGEPLPVVTTEFRKQLDAPGLVLHGVIPDTGADASALPWADCEQLNLDPRDGGSRRNGRRRANRRCDGCLFRVGAPRWRYVRLSTRRERPVEEPLQADFTGHERILGRDVLNRVELLFRGPAREVVINP